MNEEAEEFFYGDLYEEVTTAQIIDTSRWNTFYEQIFKRKSDNTFWQCNWHRGSTEYQDNGIENFEFVEVVPYEKVITAYKVKE